MICDECEHMRTDITRVPYGDTTALIIEVCCYIDCDPDACRAETEREEEDENDSIDA